MTMQYGSVKKIELSRFDGVMLKIYFGVQNPVMAGGFDLKACYMD